MRTGNFGAGRFGGLLELMHNAWYENEALHPVSEELKKVCAKGKIGSATILPEPPFAGNHGFVDDMVARVRKFVAGD